ncbi:MAG: winged helix-turn-helix domain-containing protein [Sporichthyaceae bacterium]|nr:winged helix-turn-helix domain-containing protein [Sporichthyaceae bacterium]
MIDHDAPTPVYVQIGQIIAERIRSGELAPGRPVPSEKSMVQEFGVARDTARRAVAWLRAEGLVYTVAQRGSYVREG